MFTTGIGKFMIVSFLGTSWTNYALVLYELAGGGDSPILNSVDRLTLSAAAIIACGILWRALSKKDELLVDITKSVTATLTVVADSIKEMRTVIEESVRSKQELKEAVNELRFGLAALPCTKVDDHPPRSPARMIQQGGGNG